MERPKLIRLDSTDALRTHAEAWDRLWLRSQVTLPTARAELVRHWIDRFAPDARLAVLAVEHRGELVGALPLIDRRVKRCFHAGDLTWNYWSPNAELLLDPTADVPAVCDLLAEGISRAPWPLLWLEMVPFERPYWQALLEALSRRGLSYRLEPRYRIAQADVSVPYETFLADRSRSLHKNLRKDTRRIEERGPLELELLDRFEPGEVESPLLTAFEIEQASWKEAGGDTVLNTPSMFDFYRRQAEVLARWDSLRIALLRLAGCPIAFEVGWVGHGVYHSYKVGFDAEFQSFGPGHLLRAKLLEAFCADASITTVDFQGPMTEALNTWSTSSYGIGRLVIAPAGPAGRIAMCGYRVAVFACHCLLVSSA